MGRIVHIAPEARRMRALSAGESAAVAEWNQNIAAEIAATIRAMFRRESLYAPRIFAHLYLTLAMTQPFRHLPAQTRPEAA